MLHLHHLKLTLGVTLALAAVSAAPAAAWVDGPTRPLVSVSTPSSAQPSATPCSEVCYGGAASYGVSTPRTPAPVIRVVSHDGGFDWGDAAIGGGAAALILLTIGGGVGATATRRARRLGGSTATLAS